MTNPMEAFWRIYSGEIPVAVLMGGRGTGKTRSLSMLAIAMTLFRDRYQVAHVGATQAQAMRCYACVSEYVGPGAPPERPGDAHSPH